MSIAFIFWLLMLLWLIFGIIGSAPIQIGGNAYPGWPGHVLLWILLALLGWASFGFPIRG